MNDTPDFEELDHTADAAIRVRAPDLPTLFRRAAQGMFRIILPAEIGGTDAVLLPVVLHADGAEALLHAWLSELLYLHMTRRVIPAEFNIDALDSAGSLRASVLAMPLSQELESDATEIKAVTWHGFTLKHDDAGWTAEVIFDV